MMKRFISMLWVAIIASTMIAMAQNPNRLNEAQLGARTDMFNYLVTQNLNPEIDSDGDIKFKSGKYNYYISVSSEEQNPMYMTMALYLDYPENYSREIFVKATEELHKYRGAKIMCLNNSYKIVSEMYLTSAEPFKSVFHLLKKRIDGIHSKVNTECEYVLATSASTAAPATTTTSVPAPTMPFPFIVSSMEVANVESDGATIQDYGTPIYSYQTKYLRPRVTITPLQSAGNYKVLVRLYRDDMLQSNTSVSPQHFTYEEEIVVDGSMGQTIYLMGWGSSTAGTWVPGSYRYEVWYDNFCIGSASFSVM